MIRSIVVAALACSALLAAPRAALGAEPPAADGPTLSIALRKYDEGREAYHAGDYARALTAFEASLALRASPNTQLFIGRCLARLGKVASAHAVLTLASKEAEDVFVTQHDPRYRATSDAATNEAASLAPRVPRLEIILPAPPPGGVEVKLNGQVVPRETLDSLEIDPGALSVEVTAPGFAPFALRRPIGEGERVRLEVRLVPEERHVGEETAGVPVAEKPAVVRQPPVVPVVREPSSRPTWLAVVLGGAGVAALGVGAGLGLDALSVQQSELAKPIAERAPSVRDRVHAEGTASFATVLTGAALVAAVPIVLFATPHHEERAAVRLGLLGVSVEGSF